MIELTNFRSAGVQSVPAGHFFAPAEGEDSELLLGGFLLGERALVQLEKMMVSPPAQWSRTSGYAISGARFVVDRKSASASGNLELGAIMLIGDRLAIVAQGNDDRRYVVAIDRDEDLPGARESERVSFTRWRAVIGLGADTETVFEPRGRKP